MLSKQYKKPSTSPLAMLNDHPGSQMPECPSQARLEQLLYVWRVNAGTMWQQAEESFSLVINRVSERPCPSELVVFAS